MNAALPWPAATKVACLIAHLALLLPFGSAAQGVYKCRTADGTTVFQQQPCEPGQGDAVQVRPNVLDHSGLRAQAARFDAQRGQALDSAGLVRSGMSVAELRQRLGEPAVVNTDRDEFGEQQQHVYRYSDGSSRYVYTSNGAVTAVQERPAAGARPRPCHSEVDIRNALVSARALDLTPPERAQALRRVESMRSCRR
jgi:hypothetical protein